MDHIYIRHLSLQRALLCVHNCQTGSEATNHDANVSSQIYAHMCICNWASVGEPHLIMLMCKPHTIRTWAVLISDSVSLQIYAWIYICNSWQCNYCAPYQLLLQDAISPAPKLQCLEGTSSHLSLGEGGSRSPWSLEQLQLHNIFVAVICTYLNTPAIYTHSPTPAHICPKGRHEPAQVLTIKSLESSTPTVQEFEERVARCSSQEIHHFCFYWRAAAKLTTA